MPTNRKQMICMAAVVVLLSTLFVQLLAVNLHTSMSWDEGHHLFDGYTVLKHHDYDLNPEVPPFVKVLAAVPLLHMNLDEPVQQGRPSQTEAFLDGKDFLFKNDADKLLLRGRLMISLLTLLLASLVFFAGKELFDTTTGLLALAFLVFDPNLLAHGALVTTDAAITFCIFAAVFAWYRYSSSPSVGKLLLVALLTGLALATKFTGLFLMPIFFLLAVVEAVHSHSLKVFSKRCAALAAVFCTAYGILWMSYGFRYAARPRGLALNPTLADYLREYSHVASPAPLLTLARWHLLPEAYIWGLANTKLTEQRDVSYLFGAVHTHGTWLYFPAAILIKSTLPFLLLLVCAAVMSFRLRTLWQRWLMLLIPVVVFLGFAMHSDMNIGVRHILPIFPFLYILGASVLSSLICRDKRWVFAALVLIIWQAISSARSFPGYMAYANELWGGPKNVHRYLSDSNSDWGQQLKSTSAYLKGRNVTDCWMAYTAAGVVDERYYGVPCRRLPTVVSLWWLHVPMEVPKEIDGPVLISDDELEGLALPPGVPNPYAQFRSLKPSAIIDGGLFVYDGHFNVHLASEMVKAASH
ncbi:MAG TPA: glycosyltransferase family 39 protein [Edaphobacter sp.]|nr:glycosyltransferase family 39 protein [Edaphobacter sp.]